MRHENANRCVLGTGRNRRTHRQTSRRIANALPTGRDDPMPSDDMSMTMDGDQLDMTLTLTPDQMNSMGEFLIAHAEHPDEHLQRCLNAPGTYTFDPLILEGAKR